MSSARNSTWDRGRTLPVKQGLELLIFELDEFTTLASCLFWRWLTVARLDQSTAASYCAVSSLDDDGGDGCPIDQNVGFYSRVIVLAYDLFASHKNWIGSTTDWKPRLETHQTNFYSQIDLYRCLESRLDKLSLINEMLNNFSCIK